ncbi:hypothetical protein LP085_31020 [Achromobacter sp. MY14]|uniref:hypothetical protein n=1 Tax=unclassified Achromobacter TaxID=2626865 RepID=UPI001E6280F9|nr:hypothetical protein [Achromobacter sp. MY14]MCD0501313.1 hypothetical protein [Achromobacter sp. MY14]
MMKTNTDFHDDFMGIVGFISSSMSTYELENRSFRESGEGGWSHVLFSKDFLRSNGWVVFPLWEGDVRRLKKEDGSVIDFLARVCAFSEGRGDRFLNVAMFEKTEWEYSKKFSALTIATRKFNLADENPGVLFEVSEDNLPYWGGGVIWASNKKFMIYFDGDNVSAIAGLREEVEELLGVSYAYCKARFVEMNLAHQTASNLIQAYVEFCNEFQ